MVFRRFGALLALRFTLILLALLGLGVLLLRGGMYAASALLGLVVILLALETFQFIRRTNRELSRFLDAVRYADFSQRFEFDSLGAGFSELGSTFTEILERFREDRRDQETELRHLKALLEHVPVPLISIHTDGSITQWNNAARRFFGSVPVSSVDDLARFGEGFADSLLALKPGQRGLAVASLDGLEQRLALSASDLSLAGQGERLISLQDIQGELDVTQMRAWQDLVRVLTHEIMNSVTPVASLAKTASDLVEEIQGDAPEGEVLQEALGDVKNAVDTAARRSDNLMAFVASYRQLTRLPEPDKSRIELSALFEEVARLVLPEWQGEVELQFDYSVQPEQLTLHADRRMLEQVLINLLTNARQVLAGHPNPRIGLTARLAPRGRVAIEVSDNGPGVEDALGERIFVPFFTTRQEGSGVGLALSRQIMIAHGGAIKYSNLPSGGALFTLLF